MPLRAVRERLRLIEYYSANRPTNRWSRRRDAAILLALVLAWPATWLLDRAHVSTRVPDSVTGLVYRDPDGRLWGWAVPPEEPPGTLRQQAVLHGAFRIDLVRQEHGFPFVSSVGPGRATVNVELFGENRRLGAAELAEDPLVRPVVEEALHDAGHRGVAAALWGDGGPAIAHRAKGWIANGIIWSIAGVLAAWLAVTAARLAGGAWTIGRAARRVRRGAGMRCVECGYDLRASVFSERCPECGALL